MQTLKGFPHRRLYSGAIAHHQGIKVHRHRVFECERVRRGKRHLFFKSHRLRVSLETQIHVRCLQVYLNYILYKNTCVISLHYFRVTYFLLIRDIWVCATVCGLYMYICVYICLSSDHPIKIHHRVLLFVWFKNQNLKYIIHTYIHM